MRTKSFSVKKLLSLILVVAMMATMVLPTSVLALEPTPGTVSSDLDQQTIVIGQAVEFTVSGAPADDAGVMVKGKYEINSTTAVEKLEYYETYTGIEGWYEFPSTVSGEFGPATGFPFSPLTSKFRVTFAEAGEYEVKVSIVTVDSGYELCSDIDAITVYGYADYSELESAISAGEAFESVKDDYTVASYQDLVDAIEAAKNVDDNLYATSQSVIDDAIVAINDAIDKLVLRTDISFMAVAVAEDAKVDYAKADEIVLVFSKPIKNTGDVFAKLDDATKAAIVDVDGIEWVSETVCKLTLKDNHALANNHEVVLAPNDEIFTTLNEPVKGAEANVVGNLTEAYQQVTATSMAATIVKSSAKPGVVAGDKIVLVFNAPVKADDDLTINGMTAVCVDTYKTVYEITLDGTEGIDNNTKLTYGSIENVALNGTFGKAEAPVVVAAVAIDNNGNPLTKDDEIVIYFNKPTNKAVVDADKIVKGAVKATWNDEKTQLTVLLGEKAEVSEAMTINLDGLGIADEYGIAEYNAVDVDVLGAFVMPIAPVVYEILAVDNNGNAILDGDQIVIYFDRPTNKVDINAELKNIANGAFGEKSEAEWNDACTILTITLGGDASVTNGMTINLGGLGIKDSYKTADYVGKDIKLDGFLVTSTAPVIKRVLAVDNNGNATTNKDNIIITFDRPTNGLTTLDLSGIIKNSNYGIGDDYSYKWNNDDTELVITLGEYATLTDGLTVNLGNLGIKDAQGTIDYVGIDVKIDGSFGTTVSPKITRAIAFTQNNKHIVRVFFNTLVTAKPGMSVYIKNFDDDNAEGKWTHNGISYYDMTLGSAHDAFVTDHFEVVFDGTLVDTETQKSAIEDATAVIKGGFEQDIKPEILSLTAYSNDGSGIAKAGDKIVLVFNSAVTSVATTDKVFTSTDNVTWTYEIKEDNEVKVGDNIKFTVKALGNTTEMNANIGGSFGYKAELKILNLTAYSNSGVGFAKQNDKLILVLNTGATKVSTPGLGEFKQVAGNTTVWEYTVKNDREVNINDHITFNIESNGNTYSDMVAYVGGSFGYKSELKLLSAVAYNEKANGIKSDSEVVLVFNTPVSDVTVSGLGTATKDNDYTWRIKLNANAPGIGENISVVVTDLITGETNKTLSNKLTGSFGYYITPEVIKATAYSKDGSGIAKADDTVIVTFNTPVTNVTVDPTIGVISQITTDDYINYVITLSVNPTVVVGDELDFTATAIATGETKTIENVKLGGSFGHKVTPEVVSATAYSNDGSGIAKADDIVVVVFNTPVDATVAEAFGTATQMDTYGNVWMITLASNSGAEVGKKFAINAISVATGEAVALNPELGGSFGTVVEPKLVSATAYSSDGSGVAKVGDKIVLVFNTPVSGVTSTLGNAVDVKDSTIWEITLSSTNVNIDDELAFNVTALANSTTKEVKANLSGSFGTVVEPKLLSATAYSEEGTGVVKVGDKIVLVFNTPVSGVTSTLGTVSDVKDSTIWEITLTNTNVALNDELTFNVTSLKNGITKEVKANLGGSFGYSEAPAVKSVVLTESGLKEIITVVFDQATSMNDINTSKLFEKNAHLGQTVTAVWTSDTVLKITLAADATTIATVLDDEKNYVSGDLLNLSGLDIKAKATNLDIEGINELAISGSLVPVVTEAKVDGTVITIKFSARTNGSADALTKIEAQTVMYGTGVNAEWTDNNRALVITMGANNALPVDAYIVLNDLGIKDGFSNTVEVKGQYAIDTKLLNRNLLGVTVFVKGVNTENAERTDYTAGQAGDQILVVFDAPTNKTQGSDAKANIELTDGKTFGTDYTAVWTSDSLITITLGEGATVTTEDKLVVKNVKFANGTGKLSDADADKTEEVLEGQFDGRQFWIEKLTTTTVAGLKRYSATIKQAPMTVLNAQSMPFVICQGYDANDKVVAIGAVQISGAYTQDVKFDFNNSSLTKIDMFVISGDYADAEAVITVYSETESK